MDRRSFLVVAACGSLPMPRSALAQPGAKVRRIGVLTAGDAAALADALNERLRELGWIGGQNLIVERRGAGGKAELVPALADDLVRQGVDVILSAGAVAGIAAKNATTVAIPPSVLMRADEVIQ